MILLPFAKVTISQYNTNKIHFWDIFYLSRDNNNILPISVHQVSLLKTEATRMGIMKMITEYALTAIRKRIHLAYGRTHACFLYISIGRMAFTSNEVLLDWYVKHWIGNSNGQVFIQTIL